MEMDELNEIAKAQLEALRDAASEYNVRARCGCCAQVVPLGYLLAMVGEKQILDCVACGKPVVFSREDVRSGLIVLREMPMDHLGSLRCDLDGFEGDAGAQIEDFERTAVA